MSKSSRRDMRLRESGLLLVVSQGYSKWQIMVRRVLYRQTLSVMQAECRPVKGNDRYHIGEDRKHLLPTLGVSHLVPGDLMHGKIPQRDHLDRPWFAHSILGYYLFLGLPRPKDWAIISILFPFPEVRYLLAWTTERTFG